MTVNTRRLTSLPIQSSLSTDKAEFKVPREETSDRVGAIEL